MSANSNITDLYERIRKELFYMIPEKWEIIEKQGKCFSIIFLKA